MQKIQIYELDKSETQRVVVSAKESSMEAMKSIGRTFLVEEDEDIWMELQYFRDHSRCKEVYAKMQKDKSLQLLDKEFYNLAIHEKNLITRGFNHSNIRV